MCNCTYSPPGFQKDRHTTIDEFVVTSTDHTGVAYAISDSPLTVEEWVSNYL